jgi:hypothetical protein
MVMPILLAAVMPVGVAAQTTIVPLTPGSSFTTSTPAYTPAPMPDADLYAPLPPTQPQASAQLGPQVIYPDKQYRGDGFFPGSTSQSVQQRLLKPAPGISLTMPLQP